MMQRRRDVMWRLDGAPRARGGRRRGPEGEAHRGVRRCGRRTAQGQSKQQTRVAARRRKEADGGGATVRLPSPQGRESQGGCAAVRFPRRTGHHDDLLNGAMVSKPRPWRALLLRVQKLKKKNGEEKKSGEGREKRIGGGREEEEGEG